MARKRHVRGPAQVLTPNVDRREFTEGFQPIWNPLDTDLDYTVAVGQARPADPIRQGDFPARAAWTRITTTGLRPTEMFRPFEVGKIFIHRLRGIPRGEHEPMGERINIVRPRIASYGEQVELAGVNEEI